MPFEEGNSVGIQFSSDNQPVSNGRPPGSKNRSTIARRVLDYLIRIPDEQYEVLLHTHPDLKQQLTIEEYITLQQAVLAMKETNAYKAIMDSAYGAPKQEIENLNHNVNVLSNDPLNAPTDDGITEDISAS